jgi:sporulation protein YlmC with PRC-barrel domain
MNADNLKGMTIVSLGEGAKLGSISEVLFATHPLRAAALSATGNGQDFIIPFEQIKNIGTDAVTVESGQVTQTASKEGAYSGLATLGALTRRKVVDEAGTLIGTIRDLDFDTTTGQVTGLTVHKGGMLGLGGTATTLDAATIRSVGNDMLTVSTAGTAPG